MALTAPAAAAAAFIDVCNKKERTLFPRPGFSVGPSPSRVTDITDDNDDETTTIARRSLLRATFSVRMLSAPRAAHV
jgi:hypothetical protein